MIRQFTYALVLPVLLIGTYVVLKLTVPFSYAEAPLKIPAVEFVEGLQESGAIDPEECAARYRYYQTDYHLDTPSHIQISSKPMSENVVRVTLYDPSCRGDSTFSSISRIYLQRDDREIWLPIRHEWSHTGRGKFGWTTEATH